VNTATEANRGAVAPIGGTPAVAASAVATPVIETHGLGKVYSPHSEAEVVALQDVNLRIARGEFVAIVGPSGSGKSTLMNLIGCLDTPSSGQYLCDGIDVAELDAEERAALRRDKIGFIFQGFNLLSRMNALDNVAMPLGYARIPVAERRRRAADVLAAVGLSERMHHRPSELSGGQQQRVAIARALIHRPAILMADEPTGALDSRTGQEVLSLFERLRDEGHTIILITHDAEVAAHADRVCVMHDGRLQTDAPSSRAATRNHGEDISQ
jgi:putative ABC transport system ATP-binding protein